MNNKKIGIIIIALAVFAVLSSGCTLPSAGCGNAACDAGETAQSCPADCIAGQGEEPPMPSGQQNGLPPELPF
ncbi:MAG: hypothetical protein PHH08_00415 [Candidatus ainarchaeum sp.]|nr:hypothetical protein [Candidatus ainarchaeum sp.]